LKRSSKRKEKKLAERVSAFIRFLLIVLGVLAASVVIYYGQNLLSTSEYFSLNKLDFRGSNRFDEVAFQKLFSRTFSDKLLSVDLDRVKNIVESDIWVKTAMVRRKLPDRLIISLVEREPTAVAAIDNELYVVDEEGMVLDAYGSEYKHLNQPIVKGLRSLARENSLNENAERIRVYFEVLEDLRGDQIDYTDSISEVDVENPERVAVIPADDPVAIYLGESSYRKRYETFLSQKDLYNRLKKKYGLIEYVDVTYEDRIIFHTPNESVAG
jgi:cell division septal protein FtsQ